MNNSLVREFCFQYLFHLQLPIFEEERKELTTHKPDLRESLQEFRMTSEATLNESEFEACLDNIQAVAEKISELESQISPYLKNWTIERISKVDRTLLILAVSELKSDKTPEKVVINEAIELAKKFGGEDSPKFVNAILDKVAKSQ